MKKFIAPFVLLLAAISLLIFSCKKRTEQKQHQQEIAAKANSNSEHGICCNKLIGYSGSMWY